MVVDILENGVEQRPGESQKDAIGRVIHDAWLSRNEWAKGGELDVPFTQLSAEEQDKDLAQYSLGLEQTREQDPDKATYEAHAEKSVQEMILDIQKDTSLPPKIKEKVIESLSTKAAELSAHAAEQYEKAQDEALEHMDTLVDAVIRAKKGGSIKIPLDNIDHEGKAPVPIMSDMAANLLVQAAKSMGMEDVRIREAQFPNDVRSIDIRLKGWE